MTLNDTFERVKAASRQLALLSDEQRNDVLLTLADSILPHAEELLDANK